MRTHVGWEGAHVAITGASRGIGRAVALAVAAKGAKVGLIARSRHDLDDVLAAAGGRGAIATADVADGPAVAAAIEQLEAELGPVDVLVANAGIGAYGAFADLDPAEAKRVISVNVMGQVHAMRAVVPGMVERRRGHIVSIGSIAGRIGAPFEAIYSASKFANVGLAEALVAELRPYDVRVSLVEPGPVATDFAEARGHAYDRARPKPASPEAVAAAVVRVVERDRLEAYVPGVLRPSVPIRHLLPGLFRKGVARSMRREIANDLAQRGGGS